MFQMLTSKFYSMTEHFHTNHHILTSKVIFRKDSTHNINYSEVWLSGLAFSDITDFDNPPPHLNGEDRCCMEISMEISMKWEELIKRWLTDCECSSALLPDDWHQWRGAQWVKWILWGLCDIFNSHIHALAQFNLAPFPIWDLSSRAVKLSVNVGKYMLSLL